VNLLAILPLAIVMIAGPQIISATLIATSQDARRNSLAFLAGVALAITAAPWSPTGCSGWSRPPPILQVRARSRPWSTGWSLCCWWP
jgi:hypothetical protein